jgi:hypothetical protein
LNRQEVIIYPFAPTPSTIYAARAIGLQPKLHQQRPLAAYVPRTAASKVVYLEIITVYDIFKVKTKGQDVL